MINKKTNPETMTCFSPSILEQFIELLPDAAMIINADGIILHQNSAAVALFPTADSWLKAISPTTDWPFQLEQSIEMKLKTPEGCLRNFQIQASNALKLGYDGYLLMLQDITARNHAKSILDQCIAVQNQIQSAPQKRLIDVLSIMADPIQEELTKLVLETESSAAYVYQIKQDDDGELLFYLVFSSDTSPEEPAENFKGVLDLPRWQEILKSGAVIYNQTAELLPEEQKILPPVDTILAVPILIENNLWGMMCLDFQKISSPWSTEEINALQKGANLIGNALQHQLNQNSLSEDEQTYQRMLENTPDAVITHAENRILFLNKAALKLYGSDSPDTLIGKNLFEYVVPEQHKIVEERILSTQEKADSFQTTPKELQLFRKDKSIIYVEATARSFYLNGKLVIQSILRDITERKKQDREREAILDISEALQGMSTRIQIFTTILNKLRSLLDIDKAIIISRNGYSSNFFIEFVLGMDEENIGRVLLEDSPLVNLIEKREPALIPDIHNFTSPPCLEFFQNMESAAIFPMTTDENYIGAIVTAKDSLITQSQSNLLGIIAGITSNALQRALLDDKANQSLQRLTALRILNLAVSGSLDLDKTLNVLLDQITNQLHVDAADIYLYDPDTHLLKHAARSGFWTNYGEYTFLKLGEGLPGQMAKDPRLIQIPCIADQKEDFVRLRMIKGERFVSYYAVPLLSKGKVKGVLELFSRRPVHLDGHWISFLEALAAEAAVAIDNAELIQQLQVSNDELTLAYDATIQGWSRTLELRDHETKGHSDRVVDLTLQLAHEMGISDTEMLHMRRGAMLHDIGKTGIPDSILLKTGPLNGEETDVMRLHPDYAMKLLSGIPFLQPALDIPYCHHEKWNGTGYPQGLKGEEIPLAARIFAVVDVFDALSYERPYRGAWTRKKVLDYIRQQSGEHFDPKVVQVFLRVLKEYELA